MQYHRRSRDLLDACELSLTLKPGLYEQLVTGRLSEALGQLSPELVVLETLDPEDGDVHIARHLAQVIWQVLKRARHDKDRRLDRQIAIANEVLAQLHALVPEAFEAAVDEVSTSKQLLGAVLAAVPTPLARTAPQRPEIPLSMSALLVNGPSQPRIGHELARELASADRVDLLCAFVKWHGFRILERPLRALVERGGQLRIITTTYMGATERRALDDLVALGAEVRISYETKTTRLHAKAWLLHRETGFSTAYIGSSNLSKSALLDGLEWNVRVANAEQPHIIEVFRATFENYWADDAFEPYDPARDAQRFDAATRSERGDGGIPLPALELRPFPFQKEILDRLDAERMIHGRWKNLVVAATGTGKTVIAALDYRRLRERRAPGREVESLLFVAHREEILKQSLGTFRAAMRDGAFGELWVGGQRPSELRHVFASVQSLARVELSQLAPGQFDAVIVDEFHHAMADTYQRLLEHLQPRVLVGLTATPERADGADVKEWFGGRIAVELRLWEALERGLLCPFQYFGLHDDVDVSQVAWKRGGYDLAQLSAVYTGHEMRAQKVAEAVRRSVTDPARMRALGFCVSIEHAAFMARRFNAYGIASRAVSARSTTAERSEALRDLRDRRLNALFAVDLFNEGVDVPEIDTVLFLRPTESATVFLQQLGRGLRLADDKPCLTVLDFIGAQHARFRFDTRFSALTGLSRRAVAERVEQGFPYLPAGCHIELDRVAAKLVLDNVRAALNLKWRDLVAEAKRLARGHPEIDLPIFVRETGVEIEDLYARSEPRGWASLAREAGLDTTAPTEDDKRLSAAFARMLHIDDVERLGFYERVLEGPHLERAGHARDGRLLAMLHFALWGPNEPSEQMAEGRLRLLRDDARRRELLALIRLLRERQARVTTPLDAGGRVPLHVHARYTRDEALAAFGHLKPSSVRQGVVWIEAEKADLLFVTLRKTEKHYSPTTRYRDYALSANRFHWESQNVTAEHSPTGQRYIHHAAQGSSVHLFIRESKTGSFATPAYTYAGPARYLSHRGNRPMEIVWALEHALLPEILEAARVAG